MQFVHSGPGHRRAGRNAIATSLVLLASACGAGITSGDSGASGGPPLPSNPQAIPLEFTVKNEDAVSRLETVRVSIPFPQGGYNDTANLSVEGHATAWHEMQRWPDGTLRMAQAQFTDTLAGGALQSYRVVHGTPALTGAFVRNDWVARIGSGAQIGAEVRDVFGVPYRAFATGAGDVVQSSPLVRVTRYRTYHQVVGGGGIGRDFLTSTFYVTEFHDMPTMLVDWVVGNDYGGSDALSPTSSDPNMHPLGVVDVNNAGFLVAGVTQASAYRGGQEGVATPVQVSGGLWYFETMANTWLDDGQTRRYRFVLYVEDPAAPTGVRSAWQAITAAMLAQPLYPLATLQTWQDTCGAGLLGGPVTGPADSLTRAVTEYQSWVLTNWFGTYGAHGDVIKTGTTGTPRNTPLSPELAHAIQGNFQLLLQKLEQMAWIQALRPYHMWGLEVGAEQDILLWDGVPTFPGSRNLSHESVGRAALWANDPYAAYRTRWVGQERAHGWDPYDHEHWSTDALFDYWTISDDAWAKDELRMLGHCLKGLMRLRNAFTATIQAARAEGWCMHGFVQTYLASGDTSIKDYAVRRAHEVVDVMRWKDHPSKVLAVQPDYANTGYPSPHQFFMPWQHGAVLYGYLGAFRHFEDPLLLRIAEDVVSTVEYSWVRNFNDPYFGFIPEGLRYYVPFRYNGVDVPANYWDHAPYRAHFGDSPLGGAHTFLIGGLYTLSLWSGRASVRAKAQHYAELIWPVADATSRWNKWCFATPMERVPQ